MAYELIIYIPTYNRREKLKDCLFFIQREIQDLDSQIHVVISDNASTDGSWEWLESLNFSWLTILKNSENLGFFGNAIKAYDLAVAGKFIWTIGDDDYLVPGALADMLSLILKYSDADFIFCNTIAYKASEHDDAISSVKRLNALPQGGNIKSKTYKGEGLISFSKMIDPRIADTLLGELMVLCFRQEKARYPSEFAQKKYSELNEIKISGVYGMQVEGWLHQPNTMVLIESFSSDTKCIYSDALRTFNFWGTAEWLGDYDYVFPLVILYLIESYRLKKIVDNTQYISLLDYYYKIMNNSLKKQLLGISSAKPFNDKIKGEMFDSMQRYLFLKDTPHLLNT